MSLSLQAVIFDMGSTLLRRPADREALARTMDARLHAAIAERYPAVTLPTADAFHALVAAELKRHDPATDSRETALAGLVAAQGWAVDAADPALMTAWHQAMIDLAWTEPQLVETLERLQRLGLRLAIVSNTGWPGPYRDRELDHFGIRDYFPVRLYSCDLGIGKPDVRIFAAALTALGNLPADATIYVGDSLPGDVAGAHRAGLWTAWLAPADARTAPADAEVPPDLMLHALNELPDQLSARFRV